MFNQKRRSMLGRRHLVAQQVQSKPVQASQVTAIGDGGGGSFRGGSSWRGQRSDKKKTPHHLDRAPKEFKKCLFSKSPGINYIGASSMQNRDRNHHSSNENLLNETGISSIESTPSWSLGSAPITPATAHQRRVELVTSRYGPSSEKAVIKAVNGSDKPTSSSSFLKQTSYSYDFDNLKPPDSPGPSRLEQLLLKEKQQQKTSSFDFDNLKPPVSPGPSRLDKLIMEKRVEQPLDPDLKKIETMNLEEHSTRLQFSPPLSSTCIGSPDSGKKFTIDKEIKEVMSGSGRKLSTIKEDCDMSIIEFEVNERTICDFDDTIKESTVKNVGKLVDSVLDSRLNNTVKENNVSRLENILADHNSNHTEELELSWEALSSRLDGLETAVMNNAVNYTNTLENLKQQIDTLTKKNERDSQEIISSIRSVKKTVESLKHMDHVSCSTENKENNVLFKVPSCKKKLLDQEDKWFNSVKSGNPGLLKTPNPNRKINQSAIWTPHSLSKVLHDQMNELYD